MCKDLEQCMEHNKSYIYFPFLLWGLNKHKFSPWTFSHSNWRNKTQETMDKYYKTEYEITAK